jgi:hypothetical protein
MKNPIQRLTGFPLWRAEHKVRPLLGSIPGNGEEIPILFEAIPEEMALTPLGQKKSFKPAKL